MRINENRQYGDLISFGHSVAVTPGKLAQLESPETNFVTKNKLDPVPIQTYLTGATKATKTIFTFQQVDKSATLPVRHRSQDRKPTQIPSFLADFLGESQQNSFFPNRATYKKESSKSPSFRKGKESVDFLEQSYTDRFTSIEGKGIPSITFRDIKSSLGRRNRNISLHLEDHNLYKPYVIEISPKSKMTLYSAIPIKDSINLKSKIKDRTSNLKFASKNVKLPQIETHLNIEKSKRFDQKDQLIVIDHHSKTFAEKLQRVKEVVDSTDFNENLKF